MFLGLCACQAGAQNYRPVENWAKLPEGWNFGECTGVAIDKQDNVWVFNRGPHPVIEFDSTGKMLQAWNEAPIKSSHGIRVDPEGNIWLVDVAGHKVMKMSPTGKLLMALGAVGGAVGDQNAPYAFNRPTNVGFAPDGSFFVTDGYGNSRVVKYSKEGDYLKQWGSKGTGESQFNIVHDIVVDKAGKLYVADRENHRIQMFDQEGKFLGQWPDLGAAWGLAYVARDDTFFMTDGVNDRVIKLDNKGHVLETIGSHGKTAGKFHYPHSVAVDSTGAVYVAEVLNWRVQKFVTSAPVNVTQVNPNSQYRLGPDSLPQDGVPKGKIQGPFTLPSKVYPGTQHTYWVYVPAQYDPKTAASLMVFQDGQAFKDENGDLRTQNVLDNLIYRREIPVMLAVFINPGRTPEQPEPNPQEWGDRTTNRPTEYNTPDDKYARVMTEELMPVLYQNYNISKDPDQHGIGGSSSGAIAAFAVAWERPDSFRKVLSNVGSFVNLRGGQVYADRVLAADRKPIRVFLCDGRNDNRGQGRTGAYDEKRDWFFQNVRLMKALTQKGYDVNYAWGLNLHGQKFGGAILPDMMRWLWRDGPVSTDPKDSVERGFRSVPGMARED